MKSMISELHLKFAQKTWNETFQLVRRCMDKPKDESNPCKPLLRSLERLQEVFTVSSMNTMRSRLEMIAKQQGMGFHVTEDTCYLTADLFYVEVVLLPCGGVEEVKVAPHGGSPVPSESFLQLLRSKHFAGFSMKLADLFSQYNIPGDNEIKLKLFASLQCLGKDLQLISHLPRVPKDSDPKVDLINNGRIGCLIAGKEDCPLTIQFYVAPTDGMKTLHLQMSDTEAVVQTAQVTVSISEVTHQLQTASVMPQLDPQGRLEFLPFSEAPHEAMPACFLLKLQPAIPVMASFVNKLSQITNVAIPDVDLQWAPLPNLLMRRSQSTNSCEESSDEQDSLFTVPLPGGVRHSYILPRAAWAAHRGTIVDSIPFTHPAHVPALLELLRHQSTINALLQSCITPHRAGTGWVSHRHFEVLPESETNFSVTFHRPDTDSLAVLLVDVSDPHHITCTVFGVGDPSVDEYLSTAMQRVPSVPVTLKMLYSKLEELTSAPLSPSHLVTVKPENDQPSPSTCAVMEAKDANTTSTTACHSAAVPDDVSGSDSYDMSVAKSELDSEMNPSAAAEPYPFTPVGVFSHWATNGSQLSELI